MVISVAKISSELADQIDGQQIEGSSRVFNPVIDANGNYIISFNEAQHLEPENFESIRWVPKPIEEIQ